MPLPLAGAPSPLRRPPPQSRKELAVRAAGLHGRTVGEVATALGCELPTESRRGKGFIGQLAERALGADPAAGDRPDFPDLGVELKTIPMRRDIPVESTFCCSVTMATADTQLWESSRLRQRLGCVLWLPVDGVDVAALAERRFGRALLWEPSDRQLAQLRADWEDLIGALGSGRAVGGHEGQILQLRPKAADASVRTLAPADGGAALARPMGFYLRASFTATILADAR